MNEIGFLIYILAIYDRKYTCLTNIYFITCASGGYANFVYPRATLEIKRV